MKTIIILIIFIFPLFSYAQNDTDVNNELVQSLVKDIKSSNKVVILGGTVKGKYTGDWLASFTTEGPFLIFSKDDKIEKWNCYKVSYVIKEGTYLKIYVDELSTQH